VKIDKVGNDFYGMLKVLRDLSFFYGFESENSCQIIFKILYFDIQLFFKFV
jgi:hypothetical protein